MEDHIGFFLEIFSPALIKMAQVYKSKRASKRDSWKKMTSDSLRHIFDQEIEEYIQSNIDSAEEFQEIIDVLNGDNFLEFFGLVLLVKLIEEGGELE